MGETPQRPLILAYHAVDSAWSSPLAVSEHALAGHAAHLRNRGFVGLTLSDAEDRRDAGTLPERAVVFTFDDGYVSTRRAARILAHHGFPGTVFVVTGFVGGDLPMRWFGVDREPPERMRSMGWDELLELNQDGWEIGSHTVTHPLLTTLEECALEEELRASRDEIGSRLGDCRSLAYPYGAADQRVAEAAARAGYEVACTLTGVETADEPLRRPRLGLGAGDHGVRLRLKTSGSGLRLRRSPMAKLVRRARRRRAWMPGGG
ncbi:MAG: polysaccharide deacetylase family protein, partial [Gaiellales bacterium]